MTLTGYAAHFGKTNLNGETVKPTSFDAALATYKALGRYPFINYNHNPTAIVGVITDMHTDDTGLWVEAEVDDSLPVMAQLLPYIQGGKIDSFSTEGYIDDITDDGHGTYTAGQFYITAVAIVPVPADPDATFTHNARRRCYLGAEMPRETAQQEMKKQIKNQIIKYL